MLYIIREKLLAEAKSSINRNTTLIKTCIALAPLFGLLGTVTGMIEVFQVMAFSGGGDARAMAGGVSKATLPNYGRHGCISIRDFCNDLYF
jgi:Biopolymer transport proteins